MPPYTTSSSAPMDPIQEQQLKILTQPLHGQPNYPPPPYTMAHHLHSSIMANPPPHVFEGDDDDMPPEDETFSSISITIKASIVVKGNNNTLSVDPAVTGSKISVAVVTGLRQMSGIAGGLPMIDENGRPRPILVDVDGSTHVEGSNNQIGERAVSMATGVAAAAAATRYSRGEGDVPKKRERSEDDPMESEAKRARTDELEENPEAFQ